MNKNLLIPVKIGGLQLQKWIKKPEVYLTFLCLLIFMLSRIMPIRIMIEATQISATPYVFPFCFQTLTWLFLF